MAFGLEQHIIDTFIDVLESNFKIDKAFIFGSRAKGNYRPDSDIDISIKGHDITTDDIITLSLAFEAKGITHKVDLIDYNSINEPALVEHIDRVGLEFYSRWKKFKLEVIADIQTGPFGSQLHMSDYTKSGTPIITVEHLGDNRILHNNLPRVSDEDKLRLIKYTLKEGDIVFSRVGSVDRRAYVSYEEDGWMFSGRLLRVRVNRDIVCPKFLSYYFGQESFKETIRRIAVGATMPSINTKILSEIDVTIPHIKEQTSIASILSSFDDKIDLLHRQNKTLEQLAEIMLRKLLVGASGVKSEDKSFADLIETTLGGEWGKEKPEGDSQLQVQCIRGTDIADLETGIPFRTPVRYIRQKRYESIEIKDGDLVMEISGGTDNQSTGRTIFINGEIKKLFKYPLVFSNFCRLIRPRKKEYSFFLYLYIHHLYKQGDLYNLENGSSGIKNLNYKALLFDIKYCIPSEISILAFNKNVEILFDKITKNKLQILTLKQTRDTLLPKLVSGEVRISYQS